MKPRPDPGAAPRSGLNLLAGVCPETLLLAGVCMLDLVSTLFWIARGEAHEGNPVMRLALRYGPGWFIAVKLFAFVPALVLAEWYRHHRPSLVRNLLRLVLGVYVILYLRSLVNQPLGPGRSLVDLLAGLLP